MGLPVVSREGGRCDGAGEVDAALDTRDRGLGGAPFKLDVGGSKGGEDSRQRVAKISRGGLSRMGT